MLGEVLRRRGVRTVVWFHADHWEPWAQGVTPVALDRVRSFIAQAKSSPYARKMTLFYLSGNEYRLKDQSRLTGDEEILELIPRSEAVHANAAEVLGELKESTDIEFQVHIHHEHLVGNDGDWNELHRHVKKLTNPVRDRAMLDYMVQTELKTMRAHTGQPLDSWAFVHGMWALNASDRSVCQIENEIEILMRHGCWGDFSFPAGRLHCDPVGVLQPFTCLPISAPKAYDDMRSKPIAVDVGASAIQDGRFLVWNSKAKHEVCSLDCYNDFNLRRLAYSDRVALSWLMGCPVIGQTLYIKTHAHSMDALYYSEVGSIPLLWPGVAAVFDELQRACDEAGVELRQCTVGEVYAELKALDRQNVTYDTKLASSSLDPASLLPTSGAKLEVGAGTWPSLALVSLLSVPILNDWLDQSPDRQRSAGNYYLSRLAQGKLFVEQELAIAAYCRREIDRSTRLVELGFGFGELSLMLAISGFRVVGFEAEAGRFAGASALVERLRTIGLQVGDLSLFEGLFPDALRLEMLRDCSRVVFVATNVTSSHVIAKLADIYRTLRLFDDVIIDLARFGEKRDEASQQEVVEILADLGFEEVTPVYVGSDNNIRHFERRIRRVAAPSLKTAGEEVRYSDLGGAVPGKLIRFPFYVFERNEVFVEEVLPRLRHVPKNWIDPLSMTLEKFASPTRAEGLTGNISFERDDTGAGLGSLRFEAFGTHLVRSNLGVFKCLTLDPALRRDQRALEIFKFAAENIVHSCVDKSIILPWARRSRYVRPDLLLTKLFQSDQPLGLHCDHASQMTAFLLHLDGYEVREIALTDPVQRTGHVVMEVYMPDQGKWVMLDPDFGVVVANADGLLQSTDELACRRNDNGELQVRRIFEKRWEQDAYNVADAFSGQLGWHAGLAPGMPTVRGDSYHRMMERFFVDRQQIAYQFRDGFEDTRVDAPGSGG